MSNERARVRVPIGVLLAAAVFTPAPAAEGVIEINQARALKGGVTAGDTAGFPVTLSTSGSYRLTGNLDTTGQPTPENVTAITIAADDIALDLAGFEILGPVSCGAVPPLSCSPVGSGNGVSVDGQNVRVENGVIRGFGSRGVSSSSGSDQLHLERLHVSDCGFGGIQAEGFVAITHCRVDRNGADGINIRRGRVESTDSRRNEGDGVECFYECIASRIHARENTGSGVNSNGGLVLDSLLFDNDGFGLDLDAPGGDPGYARNFISNNAAGTVQGGTEVGLNVCELNSTCP